MRDRFDELLPTINPTPRRQRRRGEEDSIGVMKPTYGPFLEYADVPATEYTSSGKPFSYENIVDILEMGFAYLQGYHKVFYNVEADDPWQLWFPFQAWEMKPGARVQNATTGAEYTVKDVNNKYFGVYKLEGNGAVPRDSDVLYPEEAQRIGFRIGYPNSEDVNRYYTEEQVRQFQAEPWRDTITYRFLRVEPSGVRDYFSGVRDLTPREMGKITLADGSVGMLQLQRFDIAMQFDCWAKTNEGSVKLARWFRECMKFLIPLLRGNGLDKGHFVGQEQDVHLTRWRNDIVARSLKYNFRVQENAVEATELLRQIRLKTTVAEDGEVGGGTEMNMQGN